MFKCFILTKATILKPTYNQSKFEQKMHKIKPILVKIELRELEIRAHLMNDLPSDEGELILTSEAYNPSLPP